MVLELDPDQADLHRLDELGFDVFTSVDALRRYVARTNAELAGEAPSQDAERDSEVDAETAAPSSGPGRAADAARTPGAAESSDAYDATRRAFDRAMMEVYIRGRDEVGYTATYFRGMLDTLGPLETARKLLRSSTVSDGFAQLWDRGRLDITVEAVVVRPEFQALFTEEEIAVARRRLAEFGYDAT